MASRAAGVRAGAASRSACGTSELQLIPLIALTDTVAARPLPVCRVMQNSHTWTDEPNFVLQHRSARCARVVTPSRRTGPRCEKCTA